MKTTIRCLFILCAILVLSNESQARQFQLINNSNNTLYMEVWGKTERVCTYFDFRSWDTIYCDLRSEDHPDHVTWSIVRSSGVFGPSNTAAYPSNPLSPPNVFACFDVNGKPECFWD